MSLPNHRTRPPIDSAAYGRCTAMKRCASRKLSTRWLVESSASSMSTGRREPIVAIRRRRPHHDKARLRVAVDAVPCSFRVAELDCDDCAPNARKFSNHLFGEPEVHIEPGVYALMPLLRMRLFEPLQCGSFASLLCHGNHRLIICGRRYRVVAAAGKYQTYDRHGLENYSLDSKVLGTAAHSEVRPIPILL